MFLKLAVPLAFAAIVLAQPVRGQSANATGVLSGCVIHPAGFALPGTTITVAGPDMDSRERSVIAGPDGCYHIDLPGGLYEVSATLQGFERVTRHEARIAAGRPERIDFAIGLSGICECIFLPLADYWRGADAVVQVRIERVEQDTSFASSTPATRYTARVVTVWKTYAQASLQDTVHFLQFQRRPQPESAGSELVVFLQWIDPHGVNIAGYEDNGDRPTSLLLDNGRIRHRAGLQEYEGKPWLDLISELQRLQRD